MEENIPLVLDINSVTEPYDPVSFGTCPACNTVFQLDFKAPKYDGATASPGALKFYVEQGAGLDTLVLPCFLARGRSVKRYLEIGCGFGFGLDFASRAFGWKASGIDPSALAREGKRLLGVKIQESLFEKSFLRRKKCDVIAAIEVIEHIPDPHKFVEQLRNELDQNGLLVITTPNAEAIEFARETPGLLAILSPGFHAIIYNAKSIEELLRKIGFDEVQVVVRGTTLLVVAGLGASEIKTDQVFVATIYREYLEKQFLTAPRLSILEVGFGYRLFKHLVNSGQLSEAELIWARLAAAIKERDQIDICLPHIVIAALDRVWRLEDVVERMPCCLVGLFFFYGIVRLNQHQDRLGAITFFYAAHVVAGLFRKAMIQFGIDDGETADLEFQARKHLRLVLEWTMN